MLFRSPVHCSNTAENCTRENCPVHCQNTAENCKRENCPVHSDPTDLDLFSDNNTVNAEDIDTAKAGNEQATTIEIDKDNTAAGMNVRNGNIETVKTGETDVMPIIIGLAVIAASAGAAYAIYKKKQK